MIENLKYDEKTVSWNTKSGKRVEKTHNSISNVLTNSKEVYVLYRENDRDDNSRAQTSDRQSRSGSGNR